jgi:4-diphosphocytidyl-2-C-methyl-D-erythritol kinase
VTNSLRANAPAKINLDLRVLAREADGFHQIETIFLLVNLCDVVTAHRSESGVSLEVVGAQLGTSEENLVYRAAVGFFRRSGIDAGVQIRLEKRIPAGAGLGGGSSDAATTLRLLNALFADPLGVPELTEVAAELGADVPFFLTPSGFALGWGRGDRILEMPAPEPRHVVLALPALHISTPQAYAALSHRGLDPAGSRSLEQSTLANWDRLASDSLNDFESVVFSRHPVLAEIRDALMERGAGLARMSGSGSAVFGIFDSSEHAQETAAEMGDTFGGDFVVVPTRTRWCDLVAPEG